jgi:hypothetical protein
MLVRSARNPAAFAALDYLDVSANCSVMAAPLIVMAGRRSGHPENWRCLQLLSRMAGSSARLSGLICEPYQGVIPERRARPAYRGSISRHVQASSWIPGNARGDFGNDGEDERKKNEPDSRRSSPAMTLERKFANIFKASSASGNIQATKRRQAVPGFPMKRRTSRLLNLVQLIGGKFA